MRRISKFFESLSNLSMRYTTRPAAANLAEMPDCRELDATASMHEPDLYNRLHAHVHERHREYGPIYRGRVGPVDCIFTSSPQAIQKLYGVEGSRPQNFLPEAWTVYNEMRGRKRGLLFMQGDEWWTYRQKLNHILLPTDSKSSTVKPSRTAAQDLVQSWRRYADEDRAVPDIETELYQWSIEVLLATLVGKAWPTYRRSVITDLESLSQRLGQIFEYSVQLSQVPAKQAKDMDLPSWRGFVSAADRTFEIADRVIERMERLENTEDGMLRSMVDAGIEGDMLKRIVLDLILAAGDTTSYTMQWLLFLLATNQQVQKNIYEDLSRWSEEDIVSKSLMKGAIKETLRLYPVAPFVMRYLPQDTLLAGYQAYKRELVIVSLYSSGRDEANFPEPLKFKPERWLRGDDRKLAAVNHPSATIPFAVGKRSCVGKKVVEAQIALTMTEIMNNFEISCANKNEVTMKMRMIAVPSEPLQIKLTPRH